MTQEQFDKKKKELHAQFAAEKRKAFIIWLIFNVVTSAALWIVITQFFPKSYPFAIAIQFALLFVSSWIWAKESVQLGKTEREQYVLLQDELPMKRFKYGE